MDTKCMEQVAAFRYGLIAPIVSRQTPMAPGEIKAWLAETAGREYQIPGSHKTKVSPRTLERYLAQYRRGEWEGLLPTQRQSKSNSRIPASILEKAITLRKERPERSVEQLIFLLEEGGLAPKGSLAASTLARHLRKAGVSRRELLQDNTNNGYRRFETSDAHCLWQADFQHTLYLPDPKDPKRRKKAILFAVLDDYSRVLVHSEFYWDEKLPRLEDSLKKAILRHGIPEQFYCDNGAAFSSRHLVRICGKLGIRLSHSRPYRPAGRGKIERLFRFIDTSFKPEAYEQIQNGRITSLEQLNEALAAWVDGYYHQRVHGSTGQTPANRLAASMRQPRRKTIAVLTEIFQWEEERKVDKTGCVQLNGNTYEVDLDLVGQKVCLRYDPFDLQHIQVWWQEKRYPNTRLIDLQRNFHSRVPKPVQPKATKEKDNQLSFFELAEQKRREQWDRESINYVDLQGGGGLE